MWVSSKWSVTVLFHRTDASSSLATHVYSLSMSYVNNLFGRVSEWLKERDCKFRRVMPNGGSNPPPPIFYSH